MTHIFFAHHFNLDPGRGGGRGGRDGGRGRGGGRGGRDGGRGRGRGGAGGAKVIVEPHRHEGIFVARGKEDALVTLNSTPGISVYGEKRISVEVPPAAGDTVAQKVEYRVWNPFRSKSEYTSCCRLMMNLLDSILLTSFSLTLIYLSRCCRSRRCG